MLWFYAFKLLWFVYQGLLPQALFAIPLTLEFIYHGVVPPPHSPFVSEIPREPPDPHVRVRKSKTWRKILRRRLIPRTKPRSYHGSVHVSFPLRLRRIRFFPDHCPLLDGGVLKQRECFFDCFQHADEIDFQQDVEPSSSFSSDTSTSWVPQIPHGFTFHFGIPGTNTSYDQKLLQTVSVLQAQTPTTKLDFDKFEFLTAQQSPGIEVCFDTGAAHHVLNDASLFDEPPSPEDNAPVLSGISGSIPVDGRGMFSCKMIGCDGTWSVFRGFAWYAPQCSRNLLSVQTLLLDARTVFRDTQWFHDLMESKQMPISLVTGDTMLLENLHPYQPSISIPVDFRTNLFLGMVYPRNFVITDVPDSPLFNLTAFDDQNANLSLVQKVLLEYHCRFGHVHLDVVRSILQRNLSPHPTVARKLRAASKADPCKCASCLFAKQTQRHKAGRTVHAVPESEMATKRDKLLPGERVFVDHFHCEEGGRLLTGTGTNSRTYKGGSIWVDAATGIIYTHLQETFDTHETLLGKHKFEQFLREHGIPSVLEYVCDGGSAFISHEFERHLAEKRQMQRIAPPGAHHHNGPAERAIGTCMNMARTMMIHASTHWADMSDSKLWPFAVQHAAYLLNRLPNSNSGGRAPLELLTKQTLAAEEYMELHTWGSPVYVLDPKLAAGNRIPRWKLRSRRGVYMGISDRYAVSAPLILNPHSGFVKPQFHCVFDDHFATVVSQTDDESVDLTQAPWDEMFRLRFNWQERIDIDMPLELDVDWTEPWQQAHADRPFDDEVAQSDFPDTVPFQREPLSPPAQRENVPDVMADFDPTMWFDTPSDELPASAPLPLAPDLPARELFPTPPPPAPNVPIDSIDSVIDEPILSDTPSISGSPSPETITLPPVSPVPPTASELPSSPPRILPPPAPADDPPTPRRSTRKNKGRPPLRYIDEFLMQSHYAMRATSVALLEAYDLGLVGDDKEFAVAALLDIMEYDAKIHVLKVNVRKRKSKSTSPDVLNYWQMIKSLDRVHFQKGQDEEWSELASHGAVSLTLKSEARNANAQIVPSTWTFKRKRNPFTGEIKRYKARLCLRGDLEEEVTQKYSPVGNWATIRMMLILAARFGLKTRCIDIANAFVQARLEKAKFMEIPIGYEHMPSLLAMLPEGADISDYCVKLHRSLYGAADAPKLFYEHCDKIFEKIGMTKCEKDPCLYLGDGIAVSCYVDDQFIVGTSDEKINKFISDLKSEGLPITDEGEISQYLGIVVDHKKDIGSFELTQTKLIERLIVVLGLSDDKARSSKKTPALIGEALGSCADEEGMTEAWDYHQAVGILLYISNNTRPDIAFAVSQVARFTSNPKKSHARALIRIARYLQDTKEKGLIIKPNDNLGIDAYVDADFAGTWGSEPSTSRDSVRSRAGFVITFGGCPLTWYSKLIDTICLSTMMAEYIALSVCMRHLIPIRSICSDLCKSLGLEEMSKSRMHSVIFEDNLGAMGLANAPKDTPQSKFYAVKYHWFRDHIADGTCQVKYIESKENLADIFTKMMGLEIFEYLRSKLMRWM